MENEQEILWTTDLIIRTSMIGIFLIAVLILLLKPPTKKQKEQAKRWRDIMENKPR
jgi:hypothetical protein